MKIVASMIVKNELSRYLELCIDHLLTYVDEVRVVDDGSDDGTYEWLVSGEQLRRGISAVSNLGASFYEYESEARQALLEFTMGAKPTYVLSIDADEFVGDPSGLAQALRYPRPVYLLSMEEVWEATPERLMIRIDGHWGPRSVPILWHAPQKLTAEWAIPDRKLACGREPMAVRRARGRPTRVSVYHFGWARRSERVDRAERYAIHDQGKFHANAHLDSILWPDERVRLRQSLWPTGLIPISTELAGRTR